MARRFTIGPFSTSERGLSCVKSYAMAMAFQSPTAPTTPTGPTPILSIGPTSTIALRGSQGPCRAFEENMSKRKTPLGQYTSYTTVCPRVAVRLVTIDYRKRPDLYKYKPSGILSLAEKLRRDGVPEMYGWLVSLAKCVAEGHSMDIWCNTVIEQRYDAMRAVAKRPVHPGK